MANTLPSDLAKVDPAEAWAPADVPWTPKWIAHLYRRAAFGPSPEDVKQALADGFPGTLDRLMKGDPEAPQLLEVLNDTGRYLKNDQQIRAWWLSAMIDGKHPLREKLTLFWHNHFATSYAKVQRTQLMFEQNMLIRKHALGRFRPFLLDMSRDTAMLKWLDSNQNVKGAPNENYAREVMELFSLGVGNYTEKDIQEAARAFTGWHVDSRIDQDEDTFQFKSVLHDDGAKTVFGRTGNWNGDDIIRLCCDKPDCAVFLVGKLYAFFVSETKPPAKLLAPLEARFRQSDYDIADLVKTMLGSRLFFSDHAYRKKVKWPVEFALGAACAASPGRVPLAPFDNPLAKMGQTLFSPPNVKGWRTGTDWLNSATLLARNNFAETVAMGDWSGGNRKDAPAEAVATVVDVAKPTPPLTPYPMEASAALAGSAAAVSFPTVTDPDGKTYIVPGLVPPPGSGEILPPGQPAPKKSGGEPQPAPEPEKSVDPLTSLFNPPPKHVSEIVNRIGERLYGEPVSPAVAARIEKFLTMKAASLTAKDLDNPAFRARTREALHALMCLPEYQLN